MVGLLWSTGPVKSHRPRPFAAILALVAVLFAQLAVSAYACPGADAMTPAAVVADEAPPCHEKPTQAEITPLCQAHCQQGDQSSDVRATALPAVTLLALPSPGMIVSPVRDAFAMAMLPSLLERPTGPPLAVRHCRFRI
jgi:hypothetical protein